MARVKRGNIARKRRNKILNLAKGFRGGNKNLFRTANQRVMKSISNAYREHLLEEILDDYFSTLDDDMIQEYEDYMFPIMEVMNNDI